MLAARTSLSAALLLICLAGQQAQALHCAEGSKPQPIASDDFRQGLAQWRVEQQDPSGSASASEGVLEFRQPLGATLWWRTPLSGDYEIRFSATALPLDAGGFSQRVSDLNMFWNALDDAVADGDPSAQGRDASLASYNLLRLYYVGFGANSNTSTRLRRYDGSAARTQLSGYATPASAVAEDRAGGLTPATQLHAKQPVQVRIVSRRATPADPLTLQWWADQQLVFAYADPQPYLRGWFGLRTMTGHFQIRDFEVRACAGR
ncbi:DUF6250 domain-containing protein [Roseateles oligotrophus]|uniref:DUF6250 domain-containing protein n=1 Tax=Roseateles oligotrophus TaxID=1769250 RepID=A0ABT2YBI6_9BURK|nr:DUF6250 domain-containing protein [Roseateles oligotrophus]MCV2367247.1 DUF6250 domain-containing protein [Roseateles oligotrophus]